MVKICCDSTADLKNEVYGTDLYQDNGVIVLPLYVRINEKEYLDGIDITMRELLAKCDTINQLPKTAAIDVDRFEKVFAELTADGSELVFIAISSEFSANYNNARLVAENFDGVHVVDSRNLSSGVGHVVMEAVDMAKSGLNAAEIKRRLDEEIVPKVEASFVLDRLDYMVKGGRCSAVAALGANLLSLHPCIEVIDGKMKVVKKYKGSWERCLKNYVRDRLENREGLRFERIFITYTETDESIVDAVEALVKEYSSFTQVIRTTAGCTVASHCGRRTLGILFIRE